MISALELAVACNGKNYSISTLRFNEAKNELFYHFHYQRGVRQGTVLDGSTTFEAGLPDHISFHADGTIHTTHKKGATPYRHLERVLPSSVFNLVDRGQFLPILLDSVLPDIGVWRLPECAATSSVHTWTVESVTSFSLVFILLHRRLNPKKFLEGHGIAPLLNPKHQALLVEGTQNVSIAVLFCEAARASDPSTIPSTEAGNSLREKGRQLRSYGVFPAVDDIKAELQ